MKILMIGSPRGGTTYIAKVMQAYGFDMHHEISMGGDGMVSWLMAGRPKKPPWGPKYNADDWDVVIHQVREPLACMRTYNTIGNVAWNYIRSVCPKIFEDNDPKMAQYLKMWLYWNEMAEEFADLTYCVEDIDKIMPTILKMAKYKDPNDLGPLNKINRATNSRKRKGKSHPYHTHPLLQTVKEKYEYYQNQCDVI